MSKIKTTFEKISQPLAGTQGETEMRLLEMFYNHSHYWGVPHPRSTDNKLVQVCYECGSEREVKVQLRQPDDVKINAPYRGDLAA